MQVYLIADSENRTRSLQRCLNDLSISSLKRTPHRIGGQGKNLYVLFTAPTAADWLAKAERLVARGNVVLFVDGGGGPPPLLPGFFHFPADTAPETLAALINVLLAYQEKAAHFDWITDELTKVNQSLVEETKRLKATRDELDAKNRKMTEELALANIIQNSFLPKQFPRDVPLSFAHKYIPHEYIGGDFFEILPIDDLHLGILIADVSGHGVSSALITAMLKSTFLHASQGCLAPGEVLKKMNFEFTNVMRTEHYITAFYSIIDTESLALRYATAGHPRQLILRRGGEIEDIGANGFFLGMFEPTIYEENAASLEPGDRLINFTDGLIECPDAHGNHFGRENLKLAVARHKDEDIEALSKNLIVELIAYMSESRFPDDITLLISEIIPLL